MLFLNDKFNFTIDNLYQVNCLYKNEKSLEKYILLVRCLSDVNYLEVNSFYLLEEVNIFLYF